MNKTIFQKLAAICMALIIGVSGASASVQAAPKGYLFTYHKVTVSMHMAAKKFISKAGKPLRTKVSKSCAYDGKDRTYTYKDFILYTYSNTNTGPEYVNGITFLTGKVKTKEGIKMGSTLSAVKKKYGTAKNHFGIYTYQKGKCKLQVEITNNKVTNLRYVATK